MIRLTWHGHETIESIPELLEGSESIEIVLAADYNHALFRALHSSTYPSHLEEIDISGGPELLDAFATINGLEELAKLKKPLTQSHASVHIISPPMIIITLPKHNTTS